MPNSYSNEAARAAGPDIDEDVPAYAVERIRALEKLARDQHMALRRWHRLHGPALSEDKKELERRACELLNLDPPGFDPATEGP